MKKLLLLLMFGIVFLNFISASPRTYQQGENITLSQTCDDCTYINVTKITLGNETVLEMNTPMTSDSTGHEFTYILNDTYTSSLGTYTISGFGDDSDETTWNYNFEVTSTGDSFSTAGSIVLLLAVGLFLLLGTFLFTGFTNKEKKVAIKWTYFLGSFMSFLAAINFISIFIGSASSNSRVVNFFDSFTGIMFILFWFAFGMVALIWGISFIQTWLYKKNMKQLQKFGRSM